MIQSIVQPVINSAGVNVLNKEAIGLPFKSDLSFRSTSRSGNTLTDAIGGNDATILINHFSSAGTPVLYYADNGDFDIGSGDLTIAIWLEDLSEADATRTIFGKSSDVAPPQGSYRIYTRPTGELALYTKQQLDPLIYTVQSTPSKARTYGKCFALAEFDNTAKTIKFFVNNEQIGDAVTFTGTFPAMGNQYKVVIGGSNNDAGNGFGSKFIGGMSDAWIFKKILTPTEKTTLYQRGIVSGAEAHWTLTSEGVTRDASGNTRTLSADGATTYAYSSMGSQQGLNQGFQVFLKYGADRFYPVRKDDATDYGATIATYVLGDSFDGSATLHNGYKSKITFVNDFFDRSDETIYSDAARSTDANDLYGKYDATSPKTWYIEELCQEAFDSFFNDDYKNRLFIKGNNNPYDTNKNLQELILYNTKKTGGALNKVLRYINRPYRIAGAAIAFDDLSRIDGWNKYDEEILKWKYGWKASFCINAANEALITGATTKMQRLIGRDHSIVNHTVNHLNWQEYIAEYGEQSFYDVEIEPVQGWLTTALGAITKLFGYAAQTGISDALNNILLAQGYEFIRPARLDVDFYDGSTQIVYTNSGQNPAAEDFNVSLATAKANNAIMLTTYHTIGEEDDYDTLTIGIETLKTKLQSVIDNNMKFYNYEELVPGLFT